MFKKRIGSCNLTEVENRAMVDFCEDAIFTENATAKIAAQGSEEGFLADTILIDHLFEHWCIKMQQLKDDNPMLRGLMLNEANYWEQRFQSLARDLRGVK